MLTEYSGYNKERVTTFLKYLVNAANKQKIKQDLPSSEYINKPSLITNDDLDNTAFSRLAYRTQNLTENRRQELEQKINIHYTKNKFLPYEERLRKLKTQYSNLRRRKNQPKQKIAKIKDKIKNCETLLKEAKKSQKLPSFS